jgi:hypothetical protein
MQMEHNTIEIIKAPINKKVIMSIAQERHPMHHNRRHKNA